MIRTVVTPERERRGIKNKIHSILVDTVNYHLPSNKTLAGVDLFEINNIFAFEGVPILEGVFLEGVDRGDEKMSMILFSLTIGGCFCGSLGGLKSAGCVKTESETEAAEGVMENLDRSRRYWWDSSVRM
jgi:hypothetical protein